MQTYLMTKGGQVAHPFEPEVVQWLLENDYIEFERDLYFGHSNTVKYYSRRKQ